MAEVLALARGVEPDAGVSPPSNCSGTIPIIRRFER